MRIEKKKNSPPDMNLSVFRQKVAEGIEEGPGDSLESLEKFLIQWWCRHYNRPYKDPLLQTYTLEELIFEFFDIQLRENPEKLQEALGGVEEKTKEDVEDEEWLKEMMGSEYTSKEEQERELSKIPELKQDIKPLQDFEDPDEISATFDLDDF